MYDYKNLKQVHKFTQQNIFNSHTGIGHGRPVHEQFTTVLRTIKLCLYEAYVIAPAAS
jgi:hypothetical protein